jgi:hypothetical protein
VVEAFAYCFGGHISRRIFESYEDTDGGVFAVGGVAARGVDKIHISLKTIPAP